jgi:DNA repair exonuclease SbcCD ATPase subunit
MITEAATKMKLAEGEKSELTERIKSIKAENAEHRRIQADIKNWEDLYRSINSSLPTTIIDKNKLEQNIATVRKDLQSRQAEISKIAEENQRRTKHNTRIQVILEQTETFIKELDECTLELSKIIELESYLEILKKSFSTTGLLAYKIESLVKDLEHLVNQYLGELSDGRFTLEFVVSNDKLNVQITDNGNIVDILALSSGELARVNTATLIAIRKLMSSISKSRINVLFLDEVINVLDDLGREKIVEILLQEEELNTYIVSHGWTHPLLSKIEVLKKDNVSILE